MRGAEPFTIAVPDAVIEGILARVRAYPWASLPDAGGWSAGTGLAFLRDLCAYWVDGYDWRRAEAALNRWPGYRAEAGGLRLHAVHAPGTGPDPLPLLLTHGWPGSFVEFLGVAERLADPGRFGGDPADAFHVVVPSLPGYGFSDRPPRPIGPRTVARHLDILVRETLGYPRYLAQGGDWGSAVSAWLGYDHGADRGGACAGLHLNMVSTLSAERAARTEEERAWQAGHDGRQRLEGAYMRQQSTRPQTLAYAMMDSPVGVAAWIVEKFAAWSDLPRDRAGDPDLLARYTRDELLTNVMIYLVTESFATSTWLYKGLFEEKPVSFPAGTRVEVPVGVAAFRDPVFVPPPRSLAERAYNVVRWTEMPRGGHFAALEAPDLFVEDVRAFARTLR